MEDYKQPRNLLGYFDTQRAKKVGNKTSEFPYSGIWLFTGAQGTGKTLMMMNVLREIHNDYPDALIVSDFSLYGVPTIPFTGIDDFDKYNNGSKGIIFVIDEIHTIWNSLESKSLPPSTLTVWSQNRKNRRIILGTSQRFSRVYKPIREQCTFNIECRKPFLNFYSYCCIDASLYNDNGDYIGERRPNFRHYVPHWSTFFSYDTLNVINGGEYKKC